MLSVRKQEILQSGLPGLFCILMAVIEFFTQKEILAVILLVIVIVTYIGGYIYQRKTNQEPWDELTRQNYANARRVTLLYVEFTLLIWTVLCVIGHFHVTIRASHLLFYYGTIKLFQTGTFIFYDSHYVE